jgi:hydrogenase maturation factor
MTSIKMMSSNCPSCDISVEILTFMSINSSVLYSDGNMLNLNSLELCSPIVQCQNCSNYFWKSEVFSVSSDITELEDTMGIDKCAMLNADFQEIHSLLNDNNPKFLKNESALLIFIIKSINIRLIEQKESNGDYILIHKDSVKKAIIILEANKEKETEDLLLLAELYRYESDFEKALSILTSIKDERVKWVTLKLIDACDKKNNQVITLRSKRNNFFE